MLSGEKSSKPWNSRFTGRSSAFSSSLLETAVQSQTGFLHDRTEVVLVNGNGFAVFDGGFFSMALEIANHKHLQRQLGFSLLVAGGGDILDIDALFRRDGTVFGRHGVLPVQFICSVVQSLMPAILAGNGANCTQMIRCSQAGAGEK